jgi:hypothetical protein
MARSKSDLAERDRFAILKATAIAADLIASAEHGRAGPRRIVLEAVGRGEWDDVIVDARSANGSDECKQWQIKRQNTPLKPASLKTLLSSMAKRLGEEHGDNSPTFVLGFQTLVELSGPKKLTLRVLKDLCGKAREPGVQSALLVSLASTQEAGWIEMLSAATQLRGEGLVPFLKRLELAELGGEEEIRRQGIQHLREVYENADELFELIFSYLVQRPDARFEFTFELLQAELLEKHGRRNATAAKWFLAQREHSWDQWTIAGTVGVDSCVAECWGNASSGVLLHYAATPAAENDHAERALVRLAVHRAQPASLRVTNHDDWHGYLNRRTGGTLGFDVTCKQELSATDIESAPSSGNPIRKAPGILANELNASMDEHTWSSVCRMISDRLLDPEQHMRVTIEPLLLRAMSEVWATWHALLESDRTLRSNFILSLVSTAMELNRRSHASEIRVGPKAIPAMASAVVYGLAISTVLRSGSLPVLPANNGKGSNLRLGESWAHLIALAFVSDESARFGMNVDEAAASFMADESGCALLTGTTTTSDAILNLIDEGQAPYHVTLESDADFQGAYVRKPILTAELGLRLALKSGTGAVREFLIARFQSFVGKEWAQIRDAVESAPLLEAKDAQ